MFWPCALAKVDFFEEADGSFALPLLVVDSPLAFGTAVGPACEAVGAAFEKNPRMDRWFLPDVALEFCFFTDGGGRAGVSAIASSVFAMIADYFEINESLVEYANGTMERILYYDCDMVGNERKSKSWGNASMDGPCRLGAFTSRRFSRFKLGFQRREPLTGQPIGPCVHILGAGIWIASHTEQRPEIVR
jgi:hypothetical protein